jgi:hypothetical protein
MTPYRPIPARCQAEPGTCAAHPGPLAAHPIDRTHPADCPGCDSRLAPMPEWRRRALARTLPARIEYAPSR